MRLFTFEEENMVCIYAAYTKKEVIQNLKEMKTYLKEDEVELRKLTNTTIVKLKAMTEGEFLSLDLYPDF